MKKTMYYLQKALLGFFALSLLFTISFIGLTSCQEEVDSVSADELASIADLPGATNTLLRRANYNGTVSLDVINDKKATVTTNGKTYQHATEAGGLNRKEQGTKLPKFVTSPRKGSSGKAVKITIDGNSATQTGVKQRSEIYPYCCANNKSGNDRLQLNVGDVVRYKCSIWFEQFPTPTSWINLHQVKQYQNFNGPFIQLGFYAQGPNVTDLEFKARGTSNSPAPKKLLAFNEIKMKSWYNFTIDWKYSPNSTNGYAKCRIVGKKKNGQNIDKTVTINGRIGWNGFPDEFYTVSHGMYKDWEGNKKRVVVFDNVEVRKITP